MAPISTPHSWLHTWFEQAAGRSLAPGELGAVRARAGVGKTAFLIQLALEELLTGQDVFHVALGKELTDVEARYDELLAERLASIELTERGQHEQNVNRHRVIQALPAGTLQVDRLRAALDSYRRHLEHRPGLLVIDGLDIEQTAGDLDTLRELARSVQARIWLSVRSHRDTQASPPDVDALVGLEPTGKRIQARVERALDPAAGVDEPLLLSADRLRPAPEGLGTGPRPARFQLLSGGAEGSEECFGRCAESWGLTERHFSFAGREVTRSRGLVELEDDELALGDVSWTYLTSKLQRDLTHDDHMTRVLQTIWHQVNPAGEVFCVGLVQPAGTVKGGTGWAVELAKQQHKPVWVFDQQASCWYEWFAHDWRACDPPVIRQNRFCGTGTRHLNPAGQQAIEDLFARTFGPPPATA